MTKLSKDKIAELLTLHAVGEKDKFKASEINSKMEKELNDGLEAHMKKYKDHDIWATDDYVGKPDDALIELLEKVAQLGNFSILEAFSIEAIEKQIDDTFGFKRGKDKTGDFIHNDDIEVIARELMGGEAKDSAVTATGREIRKQLEKVGWEVVNEAISVKSKIPHRMPVFENFVSGNFGAVNESKKFKDGDKIQIQQDGKWFPGTFISYDDDPEWATVKFDDPDRNVGDDDTMVNISGIKSK